MAGLHFPECCSHRLLRRWVLQAGLEGEEASFHSTGHTAGVPICLHLCRSSWSTNVLHFPWLSSAWKMTNSPGVCSSYCVPLYCWKTCCCEPCCCSRAAASTRSEVLSPELQGLQHVQEHLPATSATPHTSNPPEPSSPVPVLWLPTCRRTGTPLCVLPPC